MKGIILSDLDETLHKSAKLKQQAWKHILDFFNYHWNDSLGSEKDELRGVTEGKRPATGLSPKEFIEKLLSNLELGLKNYDRSKIPEHFERTIDLIAFLEKELYSES